MKIPIKYLALAMVLLCSLSLFGIRRVVALSPDINSDGFVNAKDAVILGAAFGTQPGDEDWNPNADLFQDNIINAKDAAVLGAAFGPQ